MEDTVTTNVIKRNGEEVHFDRAKIVNAITKANGNVERIHQMNPYHPGYGRDPHYGDAWL